MAATDKTRITKPSPIVEDDQGQLRARKGISREVVEELSKIKGEPDWMRDEAAEVVRDLRAQADPDLGRRPLRPEPRRPRPLLARRRPGATTAGTTSPRR